MFQRRFRISLSSGLPCFKRGHICARCQPYATVKNSGCGPHIPCYLANLGEQPLPSNTGPGRGLGRKQRPVSTRQQLVITSLGKEGSVTDLGVSRTTCQYFGTTCTDWTKVRNTAEQRQSSLRSSLPGSRRAKLKSSSSTMPSQTATPAHPSGHYPRPQRTAKIP